MTRRLMAVITGFHPAIQQHILTSVQMAIDSERHRRGWTESAVVPPGSKAGPDTSAGGPPGPAPHLRVIEGGRK
jgi:hypothetical protein